MEKNKTKKNILITGGCGFIGSALAQNLNQKGYKVYVIDLGSKSQNAVKDVEFIACDIRNKEEFKKLNDYKFDVIFHLAAQTSGRISQEEPELDIDTNIKGTLNLLRWMKETAHNKIVFTSSMAVYGNSIKPLKESDAINPLSNYGVSKAACENYIKMYEQYGIYHKIFRLFNVYGIGQDLKNMKQGMASIYIAQATKGDEIYITGSKDRYRDFVYIDDVINALSSTLNNDFEASKDNLSNIYNVGTGIKTTVEELINIIQKVKNKPLKMKIADSHEGDQFGTFADNSKLKAQGWQNKTNLYEGIKKMYEWAALYD